MAVATLAIEDAPAKRIGEGGSTSDAYTRTRFLGGVEGASAGMSGAQNSECRTAERETSETTDESARDTFGGLLPVALLTEPTGCLISSKSRKASNFGTRLVYFIEIWAAHPARAVRADGTVGTRGTPRRT
jgi:hypothetical protein